MSGTLIGIAFGLIAFVCICLPPQYDPAIRFKEWIDDWDKEPPEDGGLR